jgi:hypothetical protein
LFRGRLPDLVRRPVPVIRAARSTQARCPQRPQGATGALRGLGVRAAAALCAAPQVPRVSNAMLQEKTAQIKN